MNAEALALSGLWVAIVSAVLAVASIGGMLATRRGSALRSQINAWWLIFPVVSISLWLAPIGLHLLCWLIALLAMRELAALCAPEGGSRMYFIGSCLVVPVLSDAGVLGRPVGRQIGRASCRERV